MPFDPSADPTPNESGAVAATRRRVLLGAGLAGLTGTVAACGGSHGSGASGPRTGDGTLGKVTDIPVGGGKVFPDRKVVVTQPKQGEFEAFSAICTHRGCTVGSVTGGTINCPCHGSEFKIDDGSVANGPATRPLPRRSIKVENGEIRLA